MKTKPLPPPSLLLGIINYYYQKHILVIEHKAVGLGIANNKENNQYNDYLY